MSFDYKKSLGQNFLKDKNIINKIIDSINPESNDLIIEIGPGMGVLTKELVNKNCDVICFEIDERLKEYLNKIESNNLEIIFSDFLKVNIKDYTCPNVLKIHKIAEKYGIMRKTLSDNLKELGHEIINYQNMVKFDYTIFDSIDTTIDCEVKVRYSAKQMPCQISMLNDNEIQVVMKEPIKSVTPGQSAVFYIDDIVVGGGIIK